MYEQHGTSAIESGRSSEFDADAFADCPWFIDDWLRDHPKFPLDPRVQVKPSAQKEN